MECFRVFQGEGLRDAENKKQQRTKTQQQQLKEKKTYFSGVSELPAHRGGVSENYLSFFCVCVCVFVLVFHSLSFFFRIQIAKLLISISGDRASAIFHQVIRKNILNLLENAEKALTVTRFV